MARFDFYTYNKTARKCGLQPVAEGCKDSVERTAEFRELMDAAHNCPDFESIVYAFYSLGIMHGKAMERERRHRNK